MGREGRWSGVEVSGVSNNCVNCYALFSCLNGKSRTLSQDPRAKPNWSNCTSTTRKIATYLTAADHYSALPSLPKSLKSKLCVPFSVYTELPAYKE